MIDDFLEVMNFRISISSFRRRNETIHHFILIRIKFTNDIKIEI